MILFLELKPEKWDESSQVYCQEENKYIDITNYQYWLIFQEWI